MALKDLNSEDMAKLLEKESVNGIREEQQGITNHLDDVTRKLEVEIEATKTARKLREQGLFEEADKVIKDAEKAV